jgi:hypothetical protein
MTASNCIGLLPSPQGAHPLCLEACTRSNTYIMYRARYLQSTYILCVASSRRASNIALSTHCYNVFIEAQVQPALANRPQSFLNFL